MKIKPAEITDKFVLIYNSLMQRMLDLNILHTYYKTPEEFIRQMGKGRYLSAEQVEAAVSSCPLDVMGRGELDRTATYYIRRHALNAGLMTMVCSFPQNSLMWVLFVVDIVYFQREVFTVTQQLNILYCSSSSTIGFDYSNLAATAVKMEGTMLKHKVIGYAKRAIGKALRMVIEYGGRIMRGSLRNVVRQFIKWVGITYSYNVIDTAINIQIILITSAIAGLVSYWLFIPMGRRLQRKLIRDIEKREGV